MCEYVECVCVHMHMCVRVCSCIDACTHCHLIPSFYTHAQVPSCHSMIPEKALEHFQQELPALGLLGTPHYILQDKPYCVDKDVQLVCKYLKALQVGGEKGIDRLYQNSYQPVRFSSEPDLQDEECQQLLQHYIPQHIRNTKITQRLFIK